MGRAELIAGIANDVKNEISFSLGNHFSSGDLQVSLDVLVEGNKINIYLLPYWKFLEYGTPGQLQGQTSTSGGKTVSFGPSTNRKMPVKKSGDEWINLITGKKGGFALAKHIQL